MSANHKLTAILKDRKVQEVQQPNLDFTIRFEDGSTLHIKLAEPTASVMVRDAQQHMEYAD